MIISDEACEFLKKCQESDESHDCDNCKFSIECDIFPFPDDLEIEMKLKTKIDFCS